MALRAPRRESGSGNGSASGRARRLAGGVLGVLLALPALAAFDHLPLVQDLTALGRDARARGLPILLLVSRSDCGYCEKLVDEVIGPMVKSGEYRDRILIRELMSDAVEPVRDFSGRWMPADAVAGRYRASLTPTVLFLDPEGRELAPRIRGINTVDLYGFYLDRSIERAIERLNTGKAR